MKFLSIVKASAAIPSPCRPLPERLREAADAVEELAARFGFPVDTTWSAKELRLDAAHIEDGDAR